MRLLTNQANGTGATFQKEQPLSRQIDQFSTCFVWGTFDGATVTVQCSPDGANWFNTGFTATAAKVENIEARARYWRGVVAGGGGTESIQLLLQ